MQVEKSKARARAQQERIKRQMEAKRKSIEAAETHSDDRHHHMPTAEEVTVFSRASLLAVDPNSTRVDKDSWQARQEAPVPAPLDRRTLTQEESDLILHHRRGAVLVSEGHLIYEKAAAQSLVSGGTTTTTLSGYVHKPPERTATAASMDGVTPLAVYTTGGEADNVMRNAAPLPAPEPAVVSGPDGKSSVILSQEFRLSQTFVAETERQMA